MPPQRVRVSSIDARSRGAATRSRVGTRNQEVRGKTTRLPVVEPEMTKRWYAGGQFRRKLRGILTSGRGRDLGSDAISIVFAYERFASSVFRRAEFQCR
jgi:hypothetical protein